MTSGQNGAVERGTVVVSVKVPSDSPRFQGHFPGAPVFPAIATLHDLVLPSVRRAWPDLHGVSAIRRMKLARPIRPGSDLTIRVTRVPDSLQVEFLVLSGSVTCAKGTLHFRGSE